jgi:surface polysaccharide O-acyltransferase-like enzyme
MKYAAAIAQAGKVTASQSQIRASLSIMYMMNWAVPCFVMVTGALLLDSGHKIGYKKIFTKYLPKILAAIVIFSVIFEFISVWLRGGQLSAGTILTGLENALHGDSWIHMWYLYMVAAVYLMLPIYRRITESASKRDILYMLVLFAVFLMVGDFLTSGVSYTALLKNYSQYTTAELVSEIADINSPTFYIFEQKVWVLYLFLGYAVHKEIVRIKPAISVILVIVGESATAAANMLYYRLDSSSLASTVCGVLCTSNSSPLYLLTSLGMFTLLRSVCGGETEDKHKRGVRAIEVFDKRTFGIYLLHLVPITILLPKMFFNPYAYGGVFGVVLFALAVTAVTFIAVYIIGKIPLVKKLL